MLFPTHDLESCLTAFTFSKKRDFLRYCREARIYGCDFATIISVFHGGFPPFRHQSHHHDIWREDLAPTQEDILALSNKAGDGAGPLNRKESRAIRKIFALQDQRRCLSGHMFFTPSWYEWHFFYFDQRDLAEDDNHWEGGPHVHLVNWLWPNLDGRSVWCDFVRNKEVPRQALHLRYVSDDPS